MKRFMLAAVLAMRAFGFGCGALAASAAEGAPAVEMIAGPDIQTATANTWVKLIESKTGGRRQPLFLYAAGIKKFILAGGTQGRGYGLIARHYDTETFDLAALKWVNAYPEGLEKDRPESGPLAEAYGKEREKHGFSGSEGPFYMDGEHLRIVAGGQWAGSATGSFAWCYVPEEEAGARKCVPGSIASKRTSGASSTPVRRSSRNSLPGPRNCAGRPRRFWGGAPAGTRWRRPWRRRRWICRPRRANWLPPRRRSPERSAPPAWKEATGRSPGVAAGSYTWNGIDPATWEKAAQRDPEKAKKFLDELPVNQWTSFSFPRYAPGAQNRWGTVAYDTDRHQVMLWGGGHATSKENDVGHFAVLGGFWTIGYHVRTGPSRGCPRPACCPVSWLSPSRLPVPSAKVTSTGNPRWL